MLSVFTWKDLGTVGTETQEKLDSYPLLYPEGKEFLLGWVMFEQIVCQTGVVSTDMYIWC